MEDVNIPAVDGYPLAGTLFRGGSQLIIVSSATATPRRFYASFAQFLAENGYTVLTYDYRGIGDSAPDSLRGFTAKMSDWALRDMDGVIAWASAELKPSKLILIGHSIGGQSAGMLERRQLVDALVTVSAQSGYWRLQGKGEVVKTLFYVTVLMPLLTRIVGYFPWSWFGSAEDLPAGVAQQWTRWCRQPGYLLDDSRLPLDRYATFSAPVLAYSIDDDAWGTARSVDAMMGAYPNVTRRHIVPAHHGLQKVGHFGFFRPTAQPLWQDVLLWLGKDAVVHLASLSSPAKP